MEFDSNISKLQGALVSLKSRGLLNSSGSGEAVDILKETFEEMPDNVKSKMTFFMVLNTQLAVSEELEKDRYVSLFVNVTSIEKNFLIDYLYELKLQSYLNNVIENCPSALTLELIEVVIRKLKQPSFHKDDYGFEHLYELWRSLFVKIYKIERGIHADNGSEKLVLYFQELFGFIETVVKTSLKSSRVLEANFGHFIGSHFYYLFSAILFCVNLYKNEKYEFESVGIYELSVDLQNKDGKDVKEPCSKCLNVIFTGIGKILEVLTVDSWMLLSSYYFNTDSTKSMQQLIGECIYEICEAINGLNISPYVVSCLSACKIKPKEESDRVAEAGIEELISNVDMGKREWFQGLVKHPDIFKEKPINCIINHLDLGTSEDIESLLESTFSYLLACYLKEDTNLDLIRKLFLAAVKVSNDCDKWLEKVFCDYKPNLLETPSSNDELVDTFNKITNDKIVSNCDLVCLCLQSPMETLRKICKLAVYDEKQMDFCIVALKTLEPACKLKHSFEPKSETLRLLDFILLKSVLPSDLTSNETKDVITLLGCLAREKLIDREFFRKFLKFLNENLEAENFNKTHFCLESLNILTETEMETFKIDKHIFLVFLSQVLDHLSWDLKTFSTIKAECRDLVGHMVTSVIKKLEDGFQLEWTRQEVSKALKINQAYFCDLWFQFGCLWPGSGKLYTCLLTLANCHHGGDDVKKYFVDFCKSEHSSEVRASIVLSLTLLLPVCTLRQWNSMFDQLVHLNAFIHPEKDDVEVNQDVLYVFASSLYLLSFHMNEDKDVRSCYEHCIRSFSHLVERCVFKMTPSSRVRVIEKVSFCLQVIRDDEERESCALILAPILLEIVDSLMIQGEGEFYKDEISHLVKVLHVKKVVEAVSQRFRA